MYSKAASKQLRETFWISFGKSYPKRWTLYKTKIKGLSFKFHFDTRVALVSLDVEGDLEQRIRIWEKLISLEEIIKDYLPNAIFEESYLLENEKEISRVYVSLTRVSIHNKTSWQPTMAFFHAQMVQFESFFEDYKDILES
jgi:hypothetical protein